LKELFSIDNNPKNINEILFSRMLDIQGRVSNSDEFKKANIIPKTVRINQNGFIKESMSFPTFEFYEIYKHTWDDSLIKEYFETSKFLFIIFRFNSQNQLIFENIKLWNIPYEVINNYISDVYNNLRQTISEGNIVERIDKRGRRLTNFPGISFNGICHIRPHGTNGQDVYALPVADRKTGIEKFTKQCFWLNNTYIKSILQ
jgi:hypothetical protein